MPSAIVLPEELSFDLQRLRTPLISARFTSRVPQNLLAVRRPTLASTTLLPIAFGRTAILVIVSCVYRVTVGLFNLLQSLTESNWSLERMFLLLLGILFRLTLQHSRKMYTNVVGQFNQNGVLL